MQPEFKTIEELIEYIKKCVQEIPDLTSTEYVNGQRDALEQLLRDIESNDI